MIVDLGLDQRIAEVLLRLELLPQGRSVNFDPKTSGGKPEFRPPPGAREDGGKACPPKDRNLYEWYRYQFEVARDDHRRLLLIFLAERDYLHFVKPLPSRRVAGERLIESDVRSEERQEQLRAERDQEILTMGEGMSAEEAAVFLECTWQHVRVLRVRHGFNPDDGLPAEGSTPKDRARAMKAEGWSVRDIAARLNVGKSTVQDWLTQQRAA